MEEFTNRFDSIISYLMIPAAILSYSQSILEYFKMGISSLVLIDAIIGTVFIAIFFFKKYIKTDTKLKIIVILVVMTGIDLLCLGSLNGNARILFMLSCIVSIIFLPKKFSIAVSAFTSLSMYITTGLVFLSIIKSPHNPFDWLIGSFTYMIYMIIIYLSISLLKKHLMSSIYKLQQNSQKMQRMMLELKSKYDEIKNNEEKINKLAYYDQLTELPNKNMLKKYIKSRIKQNVSEGKFVIIDIINLRTFNSIYGNSTGDRVLELIGEIIRELDSPNMFAARITGGEYAIWFENTSEQGIIDFVSSLSNEIFERNLKHIKCKKIDFNISYSIYPSHGKDYTELYQKAMIAMTNVKQNTEKKIGFFNESFYEEIIKNENLKNLTEQAILRDEFTVNYQKKIDIYSGDVYGVEALARWLSNELGYVPPAIFLPIIDKLNLTIIFGENIIKNVFKDYYRLIEKFGEQAKISINISPIHMISEGFSEFVIREIKSNNINPENIILEITEQVMIEGVESVNSILKPLKDFGVKVSLDDFGSGYSSLNYLSKLSPDELKIDRSFIEQLNDKKVASLVSSIIQLRNIYGFSVVAEGVETEEQLKILSESGCHLIQGYYFSKPEALQ